MVSGILDLIQQSQYNSVLNSDPEITFFKTIFYRHTHFSTENIIEYFDNDPIWGNEMICTLSKVGDLVWRIYLNVQIDVTEIPLLTPIQKISQMYPNLINDLTIEPLKSTVELYISNVTSVLQFSKYSQVIADLGITDVIYNIVNFDKFYFNYYDEDSPTKPDDKKLTQELNNIYFFNPTSFQNSNVTLGNNSIPMEELIEVFKPEEIYLVYLFIDFYNVVQSLQTSYINNIFDSKYKSTVQNFIKHPLKTLLEVTNTITWKHLFSHFIFTNIYIDIGGTKIDEYNNHYYNIHAQLNKFFDTPSYQSMINPDTSGVFNIYIPLLFWFNKYNSLAIPTVGLRYHDIRISVTLNTLDLLLSNPIYKNLVKIKSMNLMTQYIFLTNTEKLKFSTSNLEYLIEQHQTIVAYLPPAQTSINIDLDFYMPCKELIWICQVTDESTKTFSEEYFIPNTNKNPITSSKLVFNNTKFGEISDDNYFTVVQPYDRHTRSSLNGIHVYSFALEPESYQPTGTVNLSYIPTKFIQLTFDSSITNPNFKTTIYIYAINYNVLKIANGFGRLVYE